MVFGVSDTAKLLERTRNEIFQRCDTSLTLSRRHSLEAVCEAWRSTKESWKLSADEVGVSEEVKDKEQFNYLPKKCGVPMTPRSTARLGRSHCHLIFHEFEPLFC